MHPLLHLIPAFVCLGISALFAASIAEEVATDTLSLRSREAMVAFAVIALAWAGAAISVLEVFL